jgi:hypothetical protein
MPKERDDLVFFGTDAMIFFRGMNAAWAPFTIIAAAIALRAGEALNRAPKMLSMVTSVKMGNFSAAYSQLRVIIFRCFRMSRRLVHRLLDDAGLLMPGVLSNLLMRERRV